MKVFILTINDKEENVIDKIITAISNVAELEAVQVTPASVLSFPGLEIRLNQRIPYGYRLTNTVIDNIRTSMYEEVPEESEQLKLIYSMYADTDNSLGDIVRYLNEYQIKNLRGANWNTARISEMLRNPVYVEADIDVYQFFQSQGANIYNPASDFTGYNACYLYKGTVSTSRKQS